MWTACKLMTSMLPESRRHSRGNLRSPKSRPATSCSGPTREGHHIWVLTMFASFPILALFSLVRTVQWGHDPHCGFQHAKNHQRECDHQALGHWGAAPFPKHVGTLLQRSERHCVSRVSPPSRLQAIRPDAEPHTWSLLMPAAWTWPAFIILHTVYLNIYIFLKKNLYFFKKENCNIYTDLISQPTVSLPIQITMSWILGSLSDSFLCLLILSRQGM